MDLSIRRRTLLLGVALSLLLAGCAGSSGDGLSEDPADPSGPSGPGQAPTGRVHGMVLDDETMPIAGAEIALLELDRPVLTDADGGFDFADVPYGTYRLAAGKLGYESLSRSVTVSESSPVVSVELRMSALAPAEEPRQETLIYNGKITCGTLLVPWCGLFQELEEDFGTPNPTEDRFSFNWTWEEGPEAFPLTQVLEVVWTPTSDVTGQSLTPLYFTSGSGPTDTHTIHLGDEQGSPIRFEVTQAELVAAHTAYPESPFILGIYPPLSGLTVEQRFEVFRTDFWGAPAPEGWSFLDTQ